METQTKQRVRKSPQEQINEAKAALARAQQRQRSADSRQKIVIGALAQKWLLKNGQAGRAFAGYLRSIEIRDQDRDVIDPFVQELTDNVQPLSEAPAD